MKKVLSMSIAAAVLLAALIPAYAVSGSDFDFLSDKSIVSALTSESETTQLPVEGGPQFIVEDVKGSPGEMVIVKIRIRNNPGISGVQFAYNIDNTGLRFEMAAAGDLTGGWVLGDTYGLAQFTSDDGCNIEAKDGVLGMFAFTLPEDMRDGIYEIKLSELEVCRYHEDINKQIMVDS